MMIYHIKIDNTISSLIFQPKITGLSVVEARNIVLCSLEFKKLVKMRSRQRPPHLDIY